MTADLPSATTTAPPGSRPAGPLAAFGSELYVLVTGGILTGAIVAGVGSRLAMLVLRLTSPDHVVGRQSDDDFTIGRFTLAGTYNLLLIGAGVGLIGAAAYQWVRPWLLGPRWFRVLTLAAASAAVVGSMLVHADGIDFTVLKPMWLAVGLFVALPALFAVSIAFAVEHVERRVDDHPLVGWRAWIVPVVLVAAFPPTVVLVAISAAVLLAWIGCRQHPVVLRIKRHVVTGLVARAAWLAVAVLGMAALLGDITDLRGA
jgi:hypothetical protein